MLEFSYQRTLEASDMFNQAFSATHDPHLLIGPLRHGALRRLRRHPTSITASSKGVVVTGGNRGFGYAMSQEFLKEGDAVVLCGRNSDDVNAAVKALQTEAPRSQVHGMRCDVSVADDVAELGQFAGQQLGTVHLWINNAGQVTRKRLLADVDASDISSAVGSNVMGSLLGSREAIRLMRQQPAHPKTVYHIFNLGFSRWGASFSKSACTHKATKAALTQLTHSLSEELVEASPALAATTCLQGWC
ncbi:hypothetical protein CVIRNUC_010041 [Coccomyxa viridis]|uniref:Uncharacterized protein n=1 Tax=Coccomyxa viridis TaxID=1274662 RepID=A0AAV1IHV1_9CHLO|nr:hypothetical protein CVIRNUC_010041 [Coccomyxa viridis]